MIFKLRPSKLGSVGISKKILGFRIKKIIILFFTYRIWEVYRIMGLRCKPKKIKIKYAVLWITM